MYGGCTHYFEFASFIITIAVIVYNSIVLLILSIPHSFFYCLSTPYIYIELLGTPPTLFNFKIKRYGRRCFSNMCKMGITFAICCNATNIDCATSYDNGQCCLNFLFSKHLVKQLMQELLHPKGFIPNMILLI